MGEGLALPAARARAGDPGGGAPHSAPPAVLWGGMSEAGGAGPGGGGVGAGLGGLPPQPPAPPPAPPQGSPCAAAGGSGACGPATAVAAAGTAEGPGGGGSARIAVKKAQLRSAPRAKKLEKLGVYSACKVRARHRAPAAGARVGPADPRPPPPAPRPPPPSRLGPLHRGSAAVACAQGAAARARVRLGWKKGDRPAESLSFLPLGGGAAASALLGCPGALLLSRSSPEAPFRRGPCGLCGEQPGAKETPLGDRDGPPFAPVRSPCPSGRHWLKGVRVERAPGRPAPWEMEGAGRAGWGGERSPTRGSWRSGRPRLGAEAPRRAATAPSLLYYYLFS